MTLQVDLAQVIVVIVALVGAFWAMAKMLITQSTRHIDAQFQAISKQLENQQNSTLHVERELMALKVELPREYVRREDHTRAVGSIHVSIDNLRLTLERVITKGA